MSRKTIVIASVVILLLVIGLRIALPHIIKDYVNKTLDELEGYQGRVEDIDLSIIRGAYQIEGVAIEKTGGKVPVPFFSADQVEFSIEWGALLKGSVVGEVVMLAPSMNFVTGPTEEQEQTAPSENWQDKVKELFPLKINRFEIIDGEIHYRDFHSEPKVDVYLNDIDALAANLTNSEDLSESLVAKVRATGSAMGSGRFYVNLQYNPYTELPTFNLDAELENIQLVKLNEFLKAYGNFDVQRGIFGLYAEFASSEGKFDGYLKPFFKDIEVFSWQEDDRNFFETIWEAVAGAVAGILENPEKEQVATKIPVSGRYDQPETDMWSAVGTLLRNAFIEALIPGIERSVTVKDIQD